MLRLLAALLTALRFLRLAIPFTPCATHLCRTRWCLSIAPERPELYARVLIPIPENGPKGWKQQDLPGSWVTLLCICPALGPRRDRPCQAITTWRCCPNLNDGKGSRYKAISGLNNTAFAIAVYASWAGSPQRCTQDSLLAASQALPGGIGYPQGHTKRFQEILHFILLFQAYPGATSTAFPSRCRLDRKSTRLNSSHIPLHRIPSSA